MEYMTEGEIVRLYQQAADKYEQIGILADLNVCDNETIVAILRRYGAIRKEDMFSVKCKHCGEEVLLISRRLKHICPKCQKKENEIKELRYKLRLNATNILNSERRVAEYNNERVRIQKQISKLEEEMSKKKKKKGRSNI